MRNSRAGQLFPAGKPAGGKPRLQLREEPTWVTDKKKAETKLGQSPTGRYVVHPGEPVSDHMRQLWAVLLSFKQN
jgi:hypothetical protein